MNRADPSTVNAVIASLKESFGERCSTGQSVREHHGRGEAYTEGFPPDAVVWPESTSEVSAVLKLCHTNGVPVIAFGAGTSLEGHVSAPFGGISLDMTKMNRVLAVHAEDQDCVVQPGISREEVNDWLRDTGLFFPIDPGANASIGGMISTRATGTTTVLYGSIEKNILALEVVMADGRIIRCGSRARKSSAGYDLVRLFCGAEGTLGVITEATLRLQGRPEMVGSGIVAFPSLKDAVNTVTYLVQVGAPLARIEFLDEVQIAACNKYSKLDLAVSPTLFIEFNGTEASVTEQFMRVAEVVADNNGGQLEWAFDEQKRAQLWKARHSAYFAARALRPGTDCLVADVCVPVSALVDCVAAARAAIDAEGLTAPILGHVGDGNYHVLFLIDPANKPECEAAERVYDGMIAHAHRVQGSCTGEHGIGLGKREQLIAEFGQPVVDLMRELKRALDPKGILNPGKIFEASTR
jgi:D-lactate dehydrogenase (cytochrome)